MAITKDLSKDEKKLLLKVFSKYGTKLDCATKKNMNRKTISEVITKGSGTPEVVNKMIEYANEYTAA